ncbi:MAG: hypothetical protein ACK5LE_03215 [Alphaproteobacteria bacterium]
MMKLNNIINRYSVKKQIEKIATLMVIIGIFGLAIFFFTKKNLDVIAFWDIKDGQFIEKPNEPKNDLGKQYWGIYYDIFPQDVIDRYIVSFALISDGIDGDLATVFLKDEKTNKDWVISIDPADTDLNNHNAQYIDSYLETFVHEFAHIISLNYDQVSPTENANYKGYANEEGFARKNSYIDLFFMGFWQGKIWQDWDTAYNYASEEERSLAIEELYHNNINNFVTGYAAENPEEDFAETFMFFILKDKPLGYVTKEQKILFFYQFPEFVRYRNHIREQIATYKQSIKKEKTL